MNRKPIFRIASLVFFFFACLDVSAQQNLAVQGANQGLPGHVDLESSSYVFCSAEIEESDCAMVQEVAGRIVPAIDNVPAEKHTWPPRIFVEDILDEDGNSIMNAFAHPCGQGIEEWDEIDCVAPDGKSIPHVRISKLILDLLVEGDEHRLGFLVGHELSHVTLGHVTTEAYARRATSDLSYFAFSREQEIASDISGVKYGLTAGYSFEKMLNLVYRFIEEGNGRSSFEGTHLSHPSWEERLTFIDDEQEELWKALISFRNGTFLLATEQYALAEDAFKNVLVDFPESHEAIANLGYSLLMQYTDALEPEDLVDFGIGHLVAGSFTERPEALEPRVRGIDETLWRDAVHALERSLQLEPGLTQARANLGLAYLLSPTGVQAATAKEYLDEAVSEAMASADMSARTALAILINASVADMAAGDLLSAWDRLTLIEDQMIDIFQWLLFLREEDTAGIAADDIASLTQLESGFLYNYALLLAYSENRADLEKARTLTEIYLELVSPSSSYWPLAYANYEALSRYLGLPALAKATFREIHVAQHRMLSAVTLSDGTTISLADPIDDVAKRIEASLGSPTAARSTSLIAGTSLREISYRSLGLRLIATHEVLAIILDNQNAPAVDIREVGIGAGEHTLNVGMPVGGFERAVGNVYELRTLVDPEKEYRFYRHAGLAAHVRDGVVSEMAITQIPIYRIFDASDER